MKAHDLYERYVAGEFSRRKRKQLEKNFTEEDKAAIQKIREENEAFFAEHPVEPILEEIQRRKQNFLSVLIIIIKRSWIAVAALLLFMLIPFLPVNKQTDTPKGKQAAEIRIYTKTADSQINALKDGDLIDTRNLLQIAYLLRQRKFGAIISIDDAKRVSFIYPSSEEPAFLLERNPEKQEVFVPFAFNLDNSEGYEIFFLLSADQRFSVSAIAAEILKQNNPADFRKEKIKDVYIAQILLRKGKIK